MNIKYIILDIDGTIYNSNKEYSKYTKDTLIKCIDNNIKIILASGRSLPDIKSISNNLGIKPIIIADNGSIIYDYSNDKLIYSSFINKDNLFKLYGVSNRVNYIFNSTNKRYKLCNLDINSYIEEYDYMINDFDSINDSISQVVIILNDKDEFYNIINSLDNIDLYPSNIIEKKNGLYASDINNKNISKGNAIKELFSILNIDNNEVVCFGDSVNDISMFKVCNNSVAMKNGIDELKNISTYITEYTNNEDGLASFIEKNILKK